MEQRPPESFDKAVKVLSREGISLIEYGQMTLPQYGYPIVVLTWEYAIPDDVLLPASDLLISHGYPLLRNDSLLLLGDDNFDTKGRSHTSNESNEKGLPRLRLVPFSLTKLSLSDARRAGSSLHLGTTIHKLDLPQHTYSLLRCIASLPKNSLSRHKPMLEFSCLLAYGIFEYEYQFKDWDKPEETDEEYRKSTKRALERIELWPSPANPDRWYVMLKEIVSGKYQARDIPFAPESTMITV